MSGLYFSASRSPARLPSRLLRERRRASPGSSLRRPLQSTLCRHSSPDWRRRSITPGCPVSPWKPRSWARWGRPRSKRPWPGCCPKSQVTSFDCALPKPCVWTSATSCKRSSARHSGLTGRRDRLVGRNHAKELQSALPECEVRVFELAPHMLLPRHMRDCVGRNAWIRVRPVRAPNISFRFAHRATPGSP